MASLSRGTTRRRRPRSTCASRLLPAQSCGLTSGFASISHARAIPIRLVVQRADGAKIDDVAAQLVVDALLYISADLRAVAAEVRTELLDAGDLRSEPHAARAM